MEDINILYGDAYELIKKVQDKSIDLIITDPPYLIEMNKGSGIMKDKKITRQLDDIKNGFDFSIFNEFERVMKEINIYIYCSIKQVNDIMNYWIPKVKHYNLLVWCKTNPPPLINRNFLSDIEYILYFSNVGLNTLKYEKHHKYYISGINCYDKNLYLHPTIKPEEQIENFIQLSSKEKDVILDAFVGSGTTAVACKNTNRRFIGFEYNKKYFEIATDRLKGIDTKGNIKLF